MQASLSKWASTHAINQQSFQFPYNTPVPNPMATIIKNPAMIVLMVGMAIVWIYRLAINVPRIAGVRIPAITNG
jgi:hypothetical protein